jgi:hypothetical protein
MDAVDRAVHQMPLGNIAFNTPTSMVRGETVVVQLLVSLREPVEELKAAVTAAGNTVGARARLSNEMKADLSGIGFTIVPSQSVQKVVSADQPTEWRWQVAATKTGTLYLDLELSAVVAVNGSTQFVDVKRFERKWTVQVAWSDRVTSFVGGNWKWLWAAIVVPIGGVLFRRLRRSRDAPEPSTGDGS